MIHCLNPYGMAHCSRFNEHHVHLNRNFLKWGNEDELARQLADYNTDEMREVYAAIAPYFKKALKERTAKEEFNIVCKLLRAGTSILPWGTPKGDRPVQVVDGGQPYDQDGVFFMGNKAEPANELLHNILDKMAKNREQIHLVDVHTGLGSSGKLTILVPDGSQAPVGVYDDSLIMTEEDKPRNFVIEGQLVKELETYLKVSCECPEVTSVMFEFGTLLIPQVLRALRLYNIWEVNGHSEEQRDAMMQKEFDAFFQIDSNWFSKVINQGLEQFVSALKASSSPTATP